MKAKRYVSKKAKVELFGNVSKIETFLLYKVPKYLLHSNPRMQLRRQNTFIIRITNHSKKRSSQTIPHIRR